MRAENIIRREWHVAVHGQMMVEKFTLTVRGGAAGVAKTAKNSTRMVLRHRKLSVPAQGLRPATH